MARLHWRRRRRAYHVANAPHRVAAFWVRGVARDVVFLGYKVISRPLQSEDFNSDTLKRLQSGAMRDQSVSGGALMSGVSVACIHVLCVRERGPLGDVCDLPWSIPHCRALISFVQVTSHA